MKKMPLTARLCFIMTAAFTLSIAIFRTVAMFVFYDEEVGYFAPGVATVLTILPICFVVACIVLSIATPKNILPTVWPEGKRNVAWVPAVLFAGCGLWELILGLTTRPLDKTVIILALLALLSSFYYIAVLIRLNPAITSLFGFAPVFWGIVAMLNTYTDQNTTMNSPVKLALQFGFLGIMLATLAELRYRYNKPTPRASLCFHCFAVFFGLTGSIPTLVFLIPSLPHPQNAPANAYMHSAYVLALLGVGIYAAVRLYVYFTIVPADAATTDNTLDTSTDIPDHTETERGAP